MPRRKKIVVLDMWSSVSTALGPSKPWLYEQLTRFFDVEVISLAQSRFNDVYLRCRAFNLCKKKWADKYYQLKESDVKTPGSFRRITEIYTNKINELPYRPDLVFQLGGLFGPVALPGVPYTSYHDQTVRMVESGWPDWLPENFSCLREEFYRLEKQLFERLDKIVTYSQAAKESVSEDYGIDDRRIDVIHPAAKIPYPSPEATLNQRKRQLLFVSTNFYLKGGDIVLDSLPIIKKAFPEVNLIIAGAKLPDEVVLDESTVSYVGRLPMEQLQKYYCESEVLLHPARYDAFPNVIKEAVVCGLPTVASSSCGIPEILDHGRAGVLLEELTAENLALQVIELLEDKQRYRLLRERCLQVRDRFSPAVVGRQMVELFHGLMEPAGLAVPAGGREFVAHHPSPLPEGGPPLFS